MRLTLKQLGNYCACYDLFAVVDGDRGLASVYDCEGDSDEPINVVWLSLSKVKCELGKSERATA